MKKRVLKIFVDFDGTITLEDVGEAIFRKFGSAEKTNKIVEDLLSDKISSRQCWDMLCDSIDKINKQELNDFINLLDIDPTFISLVRFCNDNEIELVVLSDGFDYYIDRVFDKAGLTGLKYYSNKLILFSCFTMIAEALAPKLFPNSTGNFSKFLFDLPTIICQITARCRSPFPPLCTPLNVS